jgi:hypothetical protein
LKEEREREEARDAEARAAELVCMEELREREEREREEREREEREREEKERESREREEKEIEEREREEKDLIRSKAKEMINAMIENVCNNELNKEEEALREKDKIEMEHLALKDSYNPDKNDIENGVENDTKNGSENDSMNVIEDENKIYYILKETERAIIEVVEPNRNRNENETETVLQDSAIFHANGQYLQAETALSEELQR